MASNALDVFGDGTQETPEPAAVTREFTPKWSEGEWSYAWDFDENEEDTIATTRPDGNMQAIGVAFQSWHPNNGPVIDKAEAQANAQMMAAAKSLYEYAAFETDRAANNGDELMDKWFAEYPDVVAGIDEFELWRRSEAIALFLRNRALAKARGES
jgi:hypothetical protein